MTSTKKEDYLKKYLGSTGVKKTKKKSLATQERRTVIIDDDVWPEEVVSETVSTPSFKRPSKPSSTGLHQAQRHDTDSESESESESVPAPAHFSLTEEQTVRRDLHGRKLQSSAPIQEKSKEDPLLKREEKKKNDFEWALGHVQKKEFRANQQEQETFSRTVEDPTLNTSQKEKIRWGDPGALMGLKQVTKKKSKNALRPTYDGPWEPNRFMIPPGFRWDGIDRSNGYESKFLVQINENAAFREAAYRWSTEDM